MLIHAQHVNPFIEAAMKVVKEVAGIDVSRGHLSYKARVQPTLQVSIIIGIYGALTGQVVYSLDGQLAERMVDRLMEGCPPDKKRIMFMDCLGEVANMITGNAATLLDRGTGIALNITTPAVATGTTLSVLLVPKPALVLGLSTPYGPIEMSIAVEAKDMLSELVAAGDGAASRAVRCAIS